MSYKHINLLLVGLALNSAPAFAGDYDNNSGKGCCFGVRSSEEWQFMLASPGWLAGLEGDIGINGAISGVNVDPGTIIRHLDMVASLRGEASKGRFGITGDFLYLSLSDGVGTKTIVKKLDLQVDEIIGDLGLRWRLIESERGYLDVIGGVRYVNLYQKLALQPNSERIGEASTNLVDQVGDGLRTALSESGLRNLIAEQVATSIEGFDPDRPSTLPIGPVGNGLGDRLRTRIQEIIDSKRAALATAERDRAQAVTATLRAQAQARVDGIKRELSRKIARELESKLDTTVSRTDDWFDPYIGLRGRYNFTDRLYFTAKGDVGGFGVGSDFTWQAEAALGFQLTRNIFAEAGYRALGIDYEGNGLTYNTITHGAQVTLGLNF
jgi:hypothetical protein